MAHGRACKRPDHRFEAFARISCDAVAGLGAEARAAEPAHAAGSGVAVRPAAVACAPSAVYIVRRPGASTPADDPYPAAAGASASPAPAFRTSFLAVFGI